MMRTHTMERALERYGLDISRDELRDAYRAIRNDGPTAIRLEQLDDAAWLYALRIQWTWVAAVYANNIIVTFLDRRVLDPHKPLIFERKQQLRLLEYRGVDAH